MSMALGIERIKACMIVRTFEMTSFLNTVLFLPRQFSRLRSAYLETYKK